MSSDLIDGKRKRSDSDTENIGNNFPGQNILSNMEFNLANCVMVMEELAKARVKMPPYDTTGGWTDPDMWSTFMRAVAGSDCPKMHDSVFKIIFTFQHLFMRECCYEITDNTLRKYVYAVFGPGRYDKGPLRTCNLDPKFLPIRKVDSHDIPLSALEYDGGEGSSNSSPNQRCKKKAKLTFSAPVDFERSFNPNEPSVPPRPFKKPMYDIIDNMEMVYLYNRSTKHLSPEDAGIFLYFVKPESIMFQHLAMLSFPERKASINNLLKEYKARHNLPRRAPRYLSHHQQE